MCAYEFNKDTLCKNCIAVSGSLIDIQQDERKDLILYICRTGAATLRVFLALGVCQKSVIL